MLPLLAASGIGLILSVLVGVLFIAMFAASHTEDERARPRVPPGDVAAAFQQDLPGLVAQPPVAAHGSPSGGSSRGTAPR